MDLLQYESSDDDDGDETHQQPQQLTSTAATTADSTRPGPSPTVAATSLASNASSSSKATTSTAAVMLSKRGKKVLSLQAVLPQHILEQLTRSQVRAGLARRLQDNKNNDSNNNSVNDSDSDDDSSDYATNAPQKESLQNSDQMKKKSAAAAATAATVKADAGISSFLSELHAAPIAGPPRLSSSSKPSVAAAGNSAMMKSQPMGAAFLSATTTTTTTVAVSTSTTNSVRDIHGKSTATAPSSEMKLNQTIAKDTRKPPPPAQPQGMGLRLPVVMAAPRVRAAPAISSSAMMMQSQQQQQQQQDPAGDLSDNEPASETVEAMQKSSKRSRKEMERLLRHGQLDDAVRMNDSGNMTFMEQAAPDQYAALPGEEQVIDSSSIQQHGVRVVPTPMYDPATGQTVKGIGGAKGKNQISHLLQSAASLELSRARAAAGSSSSSSSTQIGKTNRANAKRKYGW